MTAGAATVDGLAPDALAALHPELSDLAHDLGKYACFETGFVGLDADTEDLRAALRADLLATHRHGDAVESCWQLWQRLRPAALADDPDVAVIDDALARLSTLDLAGDRAALLAAAAVAREVRDATRRLRDRATARLDAAGLLDDLY